MKRINLQRSTFKSHPKGMNESALLKTKASKAFVLTLLSQIVNLSPSLRTSCPSESKRQFNYVDYVVKATLHMHKGAPRRQHKRDQVTQGWATPKPIRGCSSPSKSHLHNTEEHRTAQQKLGAQIHNF